MRPRPADRRPRLRKSLGQHHLRDGRAARPLIDFLRLAPGETVVEVGPGGGALTRELLATGARVVAIELDPSWAFRLAAELREPEGRSPREASIVVGDALELAWERLPAGWRVAGNLPYNVGTAIVERIVTRARPGTIAGFLLQREVVDRLTAQPGDEAFGALSLLVAARARAVRLGRVRPGAFVPPPEVESAFVGLETKTPPLPPEEMPELERLVRAAFGQRRKSLRNALASVYGRSEAERRLEAAGIDPGRRAETLDLQAFLDLHRSR